MSGLGARQAHTKTVQRTGAGQEPDGVVVTVLEGAGHPAVVTGARVVVGRSDSADLVIDDPTVSEYHAELRPHPGGVLVRDLRSRNGTFAGAVQIESAVVPTQSRILVGRTALRVASSRGSLLAPPTRDSFGPMRGAADATRAFFGLLARVAPTELSVLLDGETGTGKELAAQGLHQESPRKDRPFQVVDCAAIPPGLAESILFGHERGAFTGATESRPGAFEAAAGGTVFLDEIGELPLDLQPKLLRVLEQREVVRVGGRRPIGVDFRLVSASWRPLREMINEGRFRDDLYHRLAQIRVEVPSLSDRKDDVELLVLHFLRALPASVVGARAISDEALRELRTREFPGNVRELRNVIERASQLASGPVIMPEDLAFDRILTRGRSALVAREAGSDASDVEDAFKTAKQTAVDDFERSYLLRLRERAGGNLHRAALMAGVQRHHLRALFRRHGINARDSSDVSSADT